MSDGSQAHPTVLPPRGSPFRCAGQDAPLANLSSGANELQVREGDPSAPRGERADHLAGKVGIGRGLLKLTAGFEISQLARLQGELVLRLPGSIADLPLDDPRIPRRGNTESVAVLFLLDPGSEPQGLEEGIAESDVRQPGLLEIDAQRQVIEL